MRTLLMKKAVRCLATASLIVCPFVSSVTAAMPLQTTSPAHLAANSQSVKLDNNPVLARNTTEKPALSPTTSPAKEQDKKAIGRCWKRLMNMVREVSHTHPNRKPTNP